MPAEGSPQTVLARYVRFHGRLPQTALVPFEMVERIIPSRHDPSSGGARSGGGGAMSSSAARVRGFVPLLAIALGLSFRATAQIQVFSTGGYVTPGFNFTRAERIRGVRRELLHPGCLHGQHLDPAGHRRSSRRVPDPSDRRERHRRNVSSVGLGPRFGKIRGRCRDVCRTDSRAPSLRQRWQQEASRRRGRVFHDAEDLTGRFRESGWPPLRYR